MTKDLQGSSHHLKVVGGAYGKRKDFIYEALYQIFPEFVGLRSFLFILIRTL